MALVVGCWRFDERAPELRQIVESLGARTGLVVQCSTSDRPRVELPLLGEALFDWVFDAQRIEVFGFAPAHPYLWENLDATLAVLGGRAVAQAPYWRPDARLAALRKPWHELRPLQRLAMRMPAIGMSRPLDRLAR